MSDHNRLRTTSTRTRRIDEMQYRVFMALGFVLFLLATIAMRLIPARWRPARSPGRRADSVFAEARAAASIAIPFAFRG